MPKTCHSPAKTEGPHLEAADVFHQFGDDYRRTHPLPLSYLKVMHAIEGCRTNALGGHKER